MTLDDFKTVKHFKIGENWGEIEKIKPKLIYTLDAFRDFVAIPIIITRGTQGKNDAKESFHPKGLAVDIVFPKIGKYHLTDLFNIASSFGFTGVGLYPHWQYKGNVVGGLHLDIRPLKKDQNNIKCKSSRWLCILEKGKQIYLPYDFQNLKKHEII